jgi:hypothetical protein
VLIELRSKRAATFELPESLFQADFPTGMRFAAMRMKTLTVSLPCVTGPYTATNLNLRLLKSAISWDGTPIASTDLQPVDMACEIVTSTAVNDPALFEANLRDERYLPFENAGVASRWQVQLPQSPTFDYQTISDLVLTIRYLARPAYPSPNTSPPPPPATPLTGHLLMSWRHDFSDSWRDALNTLQGSQASSETLSLPSAGVEVTPYRMRSSQGITTLTPAAAWAVYRTADGLSTLGAEIDVSPSSSAGAAIAVSVVTGTDRTWAYEPTSSTFAYDVAGLTVEDIVIAYAVS